MSALPTSRPLTLEEFDQLPEKDGIQELLDGEVVQMAPPKRRHSQIVQYVEAIFLKHLNRSRVWVETGFAIGRHCPQPDVAVTHLDQGTTLGWFANAPLIAVEVASRGNTPDELEFKKDLYLGNGGREVWVVYDKTRSVVVHSAEGAVSYKDSFESAALAQKVLVAEIFGA
jgi:Uma2 family endonuclease